MTQKTVPVRTMAELERLMPAIIKKVNADQKLALRAAANPLLALEEMGYRLDPELYLITYRRIRHSKETSERLNELAEEIYRHTKKRFDPEDSAMVGEVLFRQLKLKEPIRKAMKSALGRNAPPVINEQILRSPEPAVFGKESDDPLEAARDVHPVMEPFLEYRRIDAKVPRFATREIYAKIKTGELRVPISRIRLRMTRKIPSE
jgi:hypothetical protein